MNIKCSDRSRCSVIKNYTLRTSPNKDSSGFDKWKSLAILQAGKEGVIDRHKHNTLVNTMVEGMWGFGMAFHNIFAVIPVFVQQLGAPIWLVSIIPALFLFLIGIPQFFSAFLNRDPSTLFRRNVTLHYLMSIPATMMFISFFVLGISGIKGVAVYFSLMILYALGVGFLLPVWADFLHSVSISGKRGRFLGWTFLSSSTMGFLGGLLLKQILSIPSIPFPRNFGLGFGFYTIAILIGSSFFFLMKRPKYTETTFHTPDTLKYFFKELRIIWSNNRNFRNYIISRAFFSFYLLASAFFAVLCKEKLNLDISVTGIFTAILVLSSGLSSVFMGWIGDNYGYKGVIFVIYISYIIASLLTFHISGFGVAVLIFIFAGIGNGGMFTGFMNVVYVFAEPGKNKIYYSMVDSLLAPVILFVQISGGFLVAFAGMTITYLVCIFFLFLAVLILWKKVDFPQPSRQ